MKILGIEFAPLNIPWERRLQTISVFQFTLSFLFLGFGMLFLFIYLALFTSWYPIPLAYLAWYMYDRKTSVRGGRRVEWFRTMRVWTHYANFFPIKLIKTVDLDPKQNYILGCHPHGVLCYGHFVNFATEGTGFSKIFPGIRSTLLVLSGQFMFPIFREYFMTTGSCEVSKESIEWMLTKEGKGNALALIIGGAVEALEAVPGRFVLKLKNRQGFAKLALRHGTSLVPVFSFGENDVYTQVPNPEGSLLRKVQMFMTRHFGFSPPLFHGRGIFNYTFGLVPYRTPINTVVGAPIPVEKVESPSQAEIEALHKLYVEKLVELFDTHKTKYGISADQKLTIS